MPKLDIFLSGQVEPWPARDEMEKILRAAGISCNVGRYAIRLTDMEHFVFQQYGGDLGSPVIDAEASSLERMFEDASRVSASLAAADLRHRFELYDDDRLVGYLHHRWEQEEG